MSVLPKGSNGKWKIYIYRKDVYLTFCSWLFRISQILTIVKNKAIVDVCEVCLYPCCIFVCQRCIQVVIHIGVGFCVARSDDGAMREPWRVGRVTGTDSRAFFIYRYRKFFISYIRTIRFGNLRKVKLTRYAASIISADSISPILI